MNHLAAFILRLTHEAAGIAFLRGHSVHRLGRVLRDLRSAADALEEVPS